MPRPRKGTMEVWFDCFSDMPLEDQAAALRILEQIHRLAVREAGKQKGTGTDPAVPLRLIEESEGGK